MKHRASVQYLQISEQHSGRRLDNYLFYQLKNVPKSFIYRLLRQGEIRVNKKRCRPDYRLQTDDELRIAPIRMPTPTNQAARPSEKLIAALKQATLFDSPTLLIINKPSGVSVHGGSGVHCGLIEALRFIYPNETYLELAHRLDRDTSGCLIIAKKPSILREIHCLLQQGDVKKTYHALTFGHWRQQKTIIDAPLKKFTAIGQEHLVKVQSDGKAAKTIFYCLEQFDAADLMQVSLITGRTHQIRVHAKYAGHSLAGDEKYGDKAFNKLAYQQGLKRLFLHAHSLTFTLQQQKIEVQAPLPADLQHYIDFLRQQA